MVIIRPHYEWVSGFWMAEILALLNLMTILPLVSGGAESGLGALQGWVLIPVCCLVWKCLRLPGSSPSQQCLLLISDCGIPGNYPFVKDGKGPSSRKQLYKPLQKCLQKEIKISCIWYESWRTWQNKCLSGDMNKHAAWGKRGWFLMRCIWSLQYCMNSELSAPKCP